MKYIIFIPIFTLHLLSCQTKKADNKSDIEPEISQQVVEEFQKEDPLFLVDSTSIGRAGKNKVEIKHYIDGDYLFSDLSFYNKNGKNWIEVQKIEADTSSMFSEDMEFRDYNNDGFNDLALQPVSMPARAANELRIVYIYNSKKNNLVKLKNAEQYPNLAYNNTHKCLVSHAIYGGSTTYFLRIEGDSLRRIADVTLFAKERSISKYNDDGSEYYLLYDTLGCEDKVYFSPTTYIVKDFLEEYEELLDE